MASLDELNAQAWQAYSGGNLLLAESLCRQILQQWPQCPDAVYLLGALALQAGNRATALQHFHQAAELEPGNPAARHALGEAYRTGGNWKEAAACYQDALRVRPGHADALRGLGMLALDQGDAAGAAAVFRQYVAAQPGDPRGHFHLGRAVQLQGDLNSAAACFAEAIRLYPSYAIAHHSLGTVLQARGDLEGAARHYREAATLQPNQPEPHFNLGNIFRLYGAAAPAAACYQQALLLRPDYALAHHGLGMALAALGQTAQAGDHLKTAAQLQPDLVEAYDGLGHLLVELGKIDEARTCFEEVLKRRPDHAEAFATLFRIREQFCDWGSREQDLQRLEQDVERSLRAGEQTGVGPPNAFTFPWPARRYLDIARSHADAMSRRLAPLRQALAFAPPPAPQGGRLRIGYLSRDFRNHPMMHLLGAVFGHHDRGGFEVFAYSFGPDDGSPQRRRVETECDHFVDVTMQSPVDTARRIRADGIHILLDMMGHFGDARPKIAALRPAPLQVNFIGFPGTTGAEFIDYMIGDPVTTPPQLADAFTEQLVVLPHCYLVVDQQPIGAPTTRAAHGLPEHGFVYTSFNNTFKIEPSYFDVWMRILKQVPGSVLWLLRAHPITEENLRREAAARGVAPERLVFGEYVPKADHLARLQLGDLMLDTRYYNAHTTATDSLWAGMPVLTCPGETFASRVAASLLTAVGLPELIAPDVATYERWAVELGQDAGRRQQLREKLAGLRTAAPLFDTPRFVRNLERAYRAMWDTHASGEPPQSIKVVET